MTQPAETCPKCETNRKVAEMWERHHKEMCQENLRLESALAESQRRSGELAYSVGVAQGQLATSESAAVTQGWKSRAEKAESALAEKERELGAERESLAWIRKKLELSADSKMFHGEQTIAGTLHVVWSHHQGMRYIVSHKCDDKQGEIARLSVSLADALNRAAAAEQRVEELTAELKRKGE